MAKLRNIKIYEQAEKGARTFKCAAYDLPAIRMGFSRRGYHVHRTRFTRRSDEVIFTICKHNNI